MIWRNEITGMIFRFVFFILSASAYVCQYVENHHFEQECIKNNRQDVYPVLECLNPILVVFVLPFWIFTWTEFGRTLGGHIVLVPIAIHFFLQSVFRFVCFQRYANRTKKKTNWKRSHIGIITIYLLLSILAVTLFELFRNWK